MEPKVVHLLSCRLLQSVTFTYQIALEAHIKLLVLLALGVRGLLASLVQL